MIMPVRLANCMKRPTRMAIDGARVLPRTRQQLKSLMALLCVGVTDEGVTVRITAEQIVLNVTCGKNSHIIRAMSGLLEYYVLHITGNEPNTKPVYESLLTC
jgi:hypothetical protein